MQTTPELSVGWDVVLRTVGTLVSSAAALFQLRQLLLATRASLKTDLEILKLLDSDHPYYDSIRREIDRRLKRRFGAPDRTGWLVVRKRAPEAAIRVLAAGAFFLLGYLFLRWQVPSVALPLFLVGISFVGQAVFAVTEREYHGPIVGERREDAPVQPRKRSHRAQL